MSDIDGEEAFEKILDRCCAEAAEVRHWRDRAMKAEGAVSAQADRIRGLELEAAGLREEARLAKHFLAEAEKKLSLVRSDPNTPDF